MRFRNYSLILSFIVLIALLPGCVFTPVTTTIAVNKDEIKDKIILETFNAVLYFDKTDCINELKNELLNKELCKMRLAKYEQLIEFIKSQTKDIYCIVYVPAILEKSEFNYYRKFIHNENDSILFTNFLVYLKEQQIRPYCYKPIIDTINNIRSPYIPEIVLNKLIKKGKVRIYDKIYKHYVDSISIILEDPSDGYTSLTYPSGLFIKGMNIITDDIYYLGDCDEENKYYMW